MVRCNQNRSRNGAVNRFELRLCARSCTPDRRPRRGRNFVIPFFSFCEAGFLILRRRFSTGSYDAKYDRPINILPFSPNSQFTIHQKANIHHRNNPHPSSHILSIFLFLPICIDDEGLQGCQPEDQPPLQDNKQTAVRRIR